MYKLKYRRSARNYLARLPLNIKTAIVDRINRLCSDPDSPSLDIEILKGGVGYRMRVGQYRVIYTRDHYNLIIEVVKIGSRGDIYKR